MTSMASYEVLTSAPSSVLDGWSVVENEGGTAVNATSDRLQAEVALDHPVVAFDASELRAVLSVVAPKEQSDQRAPLHLVAVLDKSGSMHGEKLRLVKQTMIFMLRYLSEKDSLGLVEYGSEVHVTCPLTRCDAEGRERLKMAVEKIQISGQTNLSGGLLKGLELHKETPRGTTPEQTVQVGNLYRRLPDDEAAERSAKGEHYGRIEEPPTGCPRVHEWTAAVRFNRPEEEALVQKVIFELHETFRDPVVEVQQPPFQLTRLGWGTFEVKITLHMKDGREFKVDHMLSFDRAETFRPVLLPLRSPGASSSSGGFFPGAASTAASAASSVGLGSFWNLARLHLQRGLRRCERTGPVWGLGIRMWWCAPPSSSPMVMQTVGSRRAMPFALPPLPC